MILYKKNIVLIVIAILFCLACTHEIPDHMEQILNENKQNKTQWVNAIKHFQKEDMQKLKALYFLLENMDVHYTIDGAFVDSADKIFLYDSIERKENGYDVKKTIKKFNSILARNKSLYNDLRPYPDFEHINSDFIIRHIDQSFKLWEESPYIQHLSFTQFCEWVLPYRVHNERIENVGDVIKGHINVDLEGLSAIEACSVINTELKKDIKFKRMRGVVSNLPYNINTSSIIKAYSGNCNDMSRHATLVMRQFGLPVRLDFTPHWGNKSSGHSWNVLLTENNKVVPFMGCESNPGEKDEFFDGKPAKIYRKSYAKTNSIIPKQDNLPSHFYMQNIKDVTSEYVSVGDISLELTEYSIEESNNIFLCLYNDKSKSWIPIEKGIRNNEEIVFKNMGTNVLYFPLIIQSNQIKVFSPPLILDERREVIFLEPDFETTQTVTLTRKYPLFKRIVSFADDMVGAIFQGSNDSTFSEPQTLYKIEKRPLIKMQKIDISEYSRYKYVRYLSADSGYANIGELAFYSGNKMLKGKYIKGGEWSANNAFDNDIVSYFSCFNPDSGWVGMAFNAPQKITAIEFIPRNDGNHIEIGDDYELFYWHFDRWKSLDRKIAKNDVVVFENVPKNAMLLLHNHTKGVEERPFIYKGNEQIFY